MFSVSLECPKRLGMPALSPFKYTSPAQDRLTDMVLLLRSCDQCISSKVRVLHKVHPC